MARTHYHEDIRRGEGPCPSPYCGCDACEARCASCGCWIAEWTDTDARTVSQRGYCDDCAEVATMALVDAVALLLGDIHGEPFWHASPGAAQPRINAAQHLTRPASRNPRRLWPTAVVEVE